MITIKKIIANRANAKHSTGPRGPEGKRASSANATTHGLFAQNTPVREEDRPVFLEFSQQIYADVQPQGPTEEFFVDHIIDQCWRLRWCLQLETDLFEWYRKYMNVPGGVGVAFAHDASQLNCFARWSRYAPLFERRLAKDLAELRKLQARRSPGADQNQEPVDPGQAEGGSPNLLEQNSESSDLANSATGPNPGPTAEPTSVPKPILLPLPTGTFSHHVVLSDEDPSQFRAYCESLWAEWQPLGATKAFFVELFAVNSWRLARLSRVEAGLYEQYRYHEKVDGGILTAFVQDASELDCFGKLAHYETQLRHSLSRILKQLLS
jgi:hypothetical protein